MHIENYNWRIYYCILNLHVMKLYFRTQLRSISHDLPSNCATCLFKLFSPSLLPSFFLSLPAEHFNMAKTFEICDAW